MLELSLIFMMSPKITPVLKCSILYGNRLSFFSLVGIKLDETSQPKHFTASPLHQRKSFQWHSWLQIWNGTFGSCYFLCWCKHTTIAYAPCWAITWKLFLPFIVSKIGEYKIVVDQGFPRSGAAQNILVGPIFWCLARRLHPLICEPGE